MDYSNQQQYANEAMYVPSTRAEAQGNSTDLIGPSGHRYAQPRNDRSSQLQLVLANFAASYFQNGGDMGNAMGAAASALQDYDNRAYRASQAAQLEEQGYSPVGIMAWIDSGDAKDLMTGMGSRKVNGIMMTGEQAQAAENAAQRKAEEDRSFNELSARDKATIQHQRDTLARQSAVDASSIAVNNARIAQIENEIKNAGMPSAKQLEAQQAIQEKARKAYATAETITGILNDAGSIGNGGFQMNDATKQLFSGSGINGATLDFRAKADAEANLLQYGNQMMAEVFNEVDAKGITADETAALARAKSKLFTEDKNGKLAINRNVTWETAQKELNNALKIQETVKARSRFMAETGKDITFKEGLQIEKEVNSRFENKPSPLSTSGYGGKYGY